MITCKEDLMNTYIENDFGELREVYLSVCSKFGLHLYHDGEQSFDVNFYDGKYIRCDKYSLEDSENVLQSIDDNCLGKYNEKQLTLSDLKPRTKVVYEKVNFSSVGECVQSVHDNYGEYFFLNKGTGEYQIAEYQDSAWYWKEDNIYIKVEKEIDWREELNEWQHTAKIGIYSPLDFEVSSLIETDPDKFLELCRVALRATGELE